MLSSSLLSFLISKLTQSLPLGAAHSAHAEPRLLEHLHLLQGLPRFTQFSEFGEVDGDGELGPELDVDEVPPGLVLG